MVSVQNENEIYVAGIFKTVSTLTLGSEIKELNKQLIMGTNYLEK